MRTIEGGDLEESSNVLVGGRRPEEIIEEQIRRKRLEREAAQQERGTAAGGGSGPISYAKGVPIQRLENGNFLFLNVPYKDRIIECIERPLTLADGGTEKTQRDHFEWLDDPVNNPRGFTLTPLEIEYQLARIAYDLYPDLTHGTAAKAYIDWLSPFLRRMLVSADIIVYHENNQVMVDSEGRIAGRQTITLPESMKESYVIGIERSVKDSTYRPDIPSEAMLFLQAILGPYAERASTVLPYCVGLDIRVDDGILIKTRFDTRYSASFPIPEWPHECVGCYGLGSNSRTFSIHVNGSHEGTWPALLVAERKIGKKITGSAPIERLVDRAAWRPPSGPGGAP